MAKDEYGRITDERSLAERQAAVEGAVSKVFAQAVENADHPVLKALFRDIEPVINQAITAALEAYNVQPNRLQK